MRDPLLYTLAALEQRLIELEAWRYRERVALAPSGFRARGEEKWIAIRVGDTWPSREFPVQMRFEATVPDSWANRPVEVHLDVGGEALLTSGGRPLGGLNPYHQRYLLTDAAEAGQSFELTVEAVPYGPFGKPVTVPTLRHAALLLPDLLVTTLHEDLLAVHDAARYLAGNEARPAGERLSDLLGRILVKLPLPRYPTDEYLSRLSQTFRTDATGTLSGLSDVWEEWRLDRHPALQLSEEVRGRLDEARHELRSELERLSTLHPASGRLLLTGHAHIDLAWLWPLEETRRKVRRTFSTVLSLMEDHPEFRFNQSMAQIYALVEEEDPELFERMKTRIQEGRWEIVGGMWVEPDGNLPSGESWVRQLLYGQRYFESRFGRRAKVCWLPDTFGYAGNLPQFLQQAGIPYFFTTKLNWSEDNAFPHDLYRWEGIDGTRVLAHTILNPRSGYNGRVGAEELGETWGTFRGKRHHDTALFPFGYGDGGGGPSKEMLNRFDRFRAFPALPKLDMGSVEVFYRSVNQADLPIWVGEQYLELHRGTYTSQSRVKALNRRLEHSLAEAETAATLAFLIDGAEYPRKELYEAWLKLLRNQFHDILPGSSVRTVYETAERELGDALTTSEEIADDALSRLSRMVSGSEEAAERLVVWNLTLDDRLVAGCFPRPGFQPFRILGPDGSDVPYQLSGDDVVVSSQVVVPGLGYQTLDLVPGEQRSDAGLLHVDSRRLENRFLHVQVGEDGTIGSIVDRRTGREAIDGRGNQIWVYSDIPRFYEAWELDRDYQTGGEELLAIRPPEVIEEGHARVGIRVRREYGDAEIVQDYLLGRFSERLEIRTRMVWRGRRSIVRALWPLNVRSHEVTCETSFGAVARPTHRNTEWDASKFEIPAHRWVDLSESGYGVSLLNDGKYGHSANGNTLGLTLLRAPVFPDPYADEGTHEFTYALYPHSGDWREGTVREAHDLNSPLRGVVVSGEGGEQPATRRLFEVDGKGLRLAAMKFAEEGQGMILRLYEAHGGRGTATVNGLGAGNQRSVDFMEEPLREQDRVEVGNRFSYKPYQVMTLAIDLAETED